MRFHRDELLVLVLIGCGMGFRCIGLGDRVYWVDEVATSIRVAGYTKAQLTLLLTDAPAHSAAQLQHLLQLTPLPPWSQTLAALCRSPEHAPLYFLLCRAWVQLWGNSIAALRSFSVLCSWLALLLIGRLSARLYRSSRAASVAMVLFALSPFFVAYAQEARPYSLWAVTLLLSCLALWEAMQESKQWQWWLYGATAVVALYTSILSVVVLFGQAIYVLHQGDRSRRRGLVGAIAIASLSFLPWLGVILSQWQQLESNTEWMRQPMGLLPLLAIWLYNVSVLIFDVPTAIGFDLPTLAKILISSLILVAFATLIYRLHRDADVAVGHFVLLTALPTPIVLISSDLVMDSQLSTAARYLLPFHLGMILAIGRYLTRLLLSPQPRRRFWGQGIAIAIVFLCCLSYSFQMQQSPKYQKSRNLHNQAIATLINQAPQPFVLAEPEQMMDILSLSFDLHPQVQIQLSSSIPEQIHAARRSSPQHPSTTQQTWFLFAPSERLQAEIQNHPRDTIEPIRQVYQPQRLVPHEIALSLWQIQ